VPSWDGLHDQVRVVFRPLASPSTIGLFGLGVGSFVLAGLQLDWVPATQVRQVALVLIGFAFVAQFVAALVAVAARDMVIATAMCVLALTWLVTGLVLYGSRPGATSKVMGLLLLMSCLMMALIGLTTALSKLAPAIVFLVASLRFGMTGIYELSRVEAWKTAAGLTGLVLAALAIYTGLAFLLEGAMKRSVLPIGRHGAGAVAVDGSFSDQVRSTPLEPGVRIQL